MKVLVTGGTGFVGRAVIAQLRRHEHEISLLVRDPNAPAARSLVRQHGVELRPGDFQNPSSLVRACMDVDAVIHLVGIISELGTQTFRNVHTVATENLLHAAVENRVKRFVHMSALGTRAGAVARYHQTKWEAENAVRRSGLNWTIFRPSIIYGPGDHLLTLFSRIARRSPLLPVVGRGEGLLQPITVEAVAECFVKSLEIPESIGGTYDLCGRERLSFEALLRQLLRAMELRRALFKLPVPMARLNAAFLEWFCPKVLGRPAPLTRDQIVMLQEDNIGNPEAAETLFQYPIIPLGSRLTELFGPGAALRP